MGPEDLVDAAERSGDVQGLLDLWQAWGSRAVWLDMETKARAEGNERAISVAQKSRRELPEVSALDALRANKRLVERMTGRRWYVMRDAREAGATWDQIGEALDMSRQAAHEWYRRKIASQDEPVADLHDGRRARAALGEENLLDESW
jgi:hypothetical protein